MVNPVAPQAGATYPPGKGCFKAFACPLPAIHGSARAEIARIKTMSSEGLPTGQPEMPNLQVMAQYIKDLSFENPGAVGEITARPQIELGVDLNVRKLDQPDMFEVELKVRVDAKNEGRALFLLELAYAGVFRLTNIPDTGTQQMILLIQAPHMLFPFVRRVVSDVVRDGGMPPLMIEPIDFMALYQARVAQAAGQPIAGNA
jgi:preprotein translocase subunit SecB